MQDPDDKLNDGAKKKKKKKRVHYTDHRHPPGQTHEEVLLGFSSLEQLQVMTSPLVVL